MILCPTACDIRELRAENSPDGALLQLAIDSAPALSSSSCAVNFTTLYEVDQCPTAIKEPEAVPLDDENHEDDDEGFDNEMLDNDEDDEGDALQGEGGRSSRGKWTAEEDETLREAVQRHGGRNWKRISDCLEGRTDVQCLHRWQKVLRPGLIKGPWTKEVKSVIAAYLSSYCDYCVTNTDAFGSNLFSQSFDVMHDVNYFRRTTMYAI